MEKLMQYIWQHRLFDHTKLVTTDGRKLRIIDNGQLNTDSGPDFFNAKISIDGCVRRKLGVNRHTRETARQ